MKTTLTSTLCIVLLSLFACRQGPYGSEPAKSATTGFGKGAPVSLQQAWATDQVLKTPESVLYDSSNDVLYVSNINSVNRESKDGDGFISTLTRDGQIQNLYWVTGLNDPKGMAIYNDVLYVADLTDVVAVSTKTGAVLGRYTTPGIQFLNDVTVDRDGTVYISDSDGKKIYQLQNGTMRVWVENTQDQRANGLLAEDGQVLSVLMSSGEVKKVGMQDQKYTNWIEGVPSADGIERYGDGYFISNWNGEVYYANEKGKVWKVLDTKDQKVNAADIGIDVDNKLLFVPTFYDNRVVAYRIEK